MCSGAWIYLCKNMTFPQEKKLNTELPFDPTTPLLDTFLAAFFTMAERQKQPRCPLTDEWVNKLCHIHAMKYYSVLKRKEIPLRTTTQNLEDVTLSEISQIQKDKYCITPFI